MRFLDTYLVRAERILLISFAALMPTNISLIFSGAKLINVVLVLWLTVALLIWVQGISAPKFRWSIALFFSLFGMMLVGLFWTTDLKTALGDFEKRAGIIALPFLICISPSVQTHRATNGVLHIFTLSSVAISIYCIMRALLDFLQTGVTEPFYYHQLSGYVMMHAVYLSMNLSLAIAFILFSNVFEKENFWIRHRVISCLSIGLLLFMICLLSGRTSILFTIVMLALTVAYWLNKRYGLAMVVTGSILSFLLLLSTIFALPKNRERFKEIISYGDEYSINKKWGDAQFRYLIWSCALEVIHDGSFLGTGTGGVQLALETCYRKNDFRTLAYLAQDGAIFNAHNQYLQTGIEFGLTGLLIFCISLGALVIHALRKKNVLLLIFISLSCAGFLTESVLERYSGVNFFYFFSALLFYWPPKLNV